MILPRRKFLTGAALLFCAPAIVRASSLMQISPIEPSLDQEILREVFWESQIAAPVNVVFQRQLLGLLRKTNWAILA